MPLAKIQGTFADNNQGTPIAEIVRKSAKPGKKVSLIREKNNPYDSNAIAVYLHTGLFKTKKHIGYITAYTALRLAPKLDQGKSGTGVIRSVYFPQHGGRPKVTIDYSLV